MSSGFGLSGGLVTHTPSSLAINSQSHCGVVMHESALAGGRSSAGPGPNGGVDNNYGSKMSGGSDCSVASQNPCSVEGAKNHVEYAEQQKGHHHGGVMRQYPQPDFGAPAGPQQQQRQMSGGDLSQGSGGGKGGGGRGDGPGGVADDSKLLANPKGIIKSFLPQAAAADSQKFDAYRELCFAHADEYYKSVRGGTSWAVCHICNSTHVHWNTLQRHLQTHIDFRPFSCEQCGGTFYSQSKLKRHQVIHIDIKPYKCPVCDRRLGRTEHLKRHLLVHTDDKPYGCSACAHITKRLDGIRRHIKRKHGVGGGAEIMLLAGRIEGQALSDIRQVMSAIDESEQRQMKPKTKKKKKKKKAIAPGDGVAAVAGINGAAEGSPSQQQQQAAAAAVMDAMAKDYGSNLLEVAERFGVSDLRLPNPDRAGGSFDGGNTGGNNNQSSKDVKKLHGGGGGGESTNNGGGGHGRSRGGGEGNIGGGTGEELKPAWPDGSLILGAIPSQQQMHLLYQSLARSAGHTGGGGAHVSGGGGDPSMGGAGTPCNLTNDLRGGGGVAGGQPAFCPPVERAVMMSGGEHAFLMNSSSVPMRYLPTPGVVDGNPGGGRAPPHVNPMLFSPRQATRNLAHFGGGDMSMSSEAMLSQYIQSQQRFAPPVWGFANPNYHNY